MKNRFHSRLAALFFLLFCCNLSAAQWPGKASSWNGYQRHDFQVDGRDSFVVEPKRAADGNPWVWRARFPGWHTDMDLILLERGFHVAYTNVSNLYGSLKAVAQWDAFYKEMTVEYGLARKVAIECVSRGGLIAYNWAKRNPAKVACIYGEAPVCDIKSWPGGKGKGQGSAKDWEKAQLAYGLSEAELMDWKDNPIDGLDKLAKARVPVLHVIGLQDEIVPAAENSFALFERYTAAGGIMTISPNLKEPEKLHGHHFPIEHVQSHADFIIANCLINNPDSKRYFTVRDDLKNTLLNIAQRKKLRVAFLGGSITYNPGWRPTLYEYFKNKYPDTEFDFIGAGIPSFGSTPHAFRFERDVWKNGKVDLLFVEAAVNDASNGRSPQEMKRAMEGIVRQARSLNPEIDIIFMHFVDPAKIKSYNNAQVPQVIQAHETVAAHYSINSLNLALEVTERINAGQFTWSDDFKNLHPSPFGQKIYADSMKRMLDSLLGIHLDPDDKIAAKAELTALDEFSYDGGTFASIDQAKLGNDWSKTDNWKPEKGKTRSGFVNVPALIAEQAGQELSFDFEGRGVGIFVAAGHDAGIIEFRIDGGKWQKQDLFTRWSSRLHLPWLYMLAPELEQGKHQLQIRLTKEKNEHSQGTACRIFHFAVNK